MDNEDIDNMNNDTDNLNSCLNEYARENDDPENPLSKLLTNSQYWDLNNLIQHYQDKQTSNKYQAKILHLNIQSLSSKFDYLKLLLDTLQEHKLQLDFILLCETLLHDGNKHLFDLPGYNFVFRNRTNKSRGGVAIYIRKNIEYKLREDLDIFVEGEFESIFQETVINNNKTVIGEIYCVPNSNINQSIERYDEIFSKTKDAKNVIIGTDQNFDLLKIESHKQTADLLNNAIANSLIPTITKPTRITHASATLIDNIYVKFYNNHINLNSAILVTDISDHLPVFCFITSQNIKLKSYKPLIFEKRQINEKVTNQIQTMIEQTNWNYLDDININDACDELTEKIKDTLDLYAPLKTIKIPHTNIIRDPWMTKGLIKSSNTCSKLYRKSIKQSKTDGTYKTYIKYRNLYNQIKRVAKQTYYAQQLAKYQHDIRQTWKIINNTMGKTNNKSDISQTFKDNNSNISDPHIIANKFCEYFTNIGLTYANNIPSSNHIPHFYLSKRKQRNPNSIFLSPTDANEIENILKTLKNKNSAGHDELSTSFMKSIGHSIAYPISVIINKSIQTGIVPDSMKIAKVIPIYKAKEKDNFSNYRPISLLTSMSKITEKIIHKRLAFFLETNKIL